MYIIYDCQFTAGRNIIIFYARTVTETFFCNDGNQRLNSKVAMPILIWLLIIENKLLLSVYL